MGGPYGSRKVDVNTQVDSASQIDAEKIKTIMGILASTQEENKTELGTAPLQPELGRTLLTNLGD